MESFFLFFLLLFRSELRWHNILFLFFPSFTLRCSCSAHGRAKRWNLELFPPLMFVFFLTRQSSQLRYIWEISNVLIKL